MTNNRGGTIIVRALGDCTIQTPISTITPNQEIVFATALFFVLNRHRKVTRDGIELAIWPELQCSSRAHHRLRQTILTLKEAGFPISRDSGFLQCDSPIIADFDEILAPPSGQGLTKQPQSFELLPDYFPRVSTAYAHWLDEKRLEINSALVRILLEQIHGARHSGQWAQVESLTRTCAAIDPYNEEAVLARAEAIALRGGKLEAMALLDQYVAELGEASPEMRLPAKIMRRRISERVDHSSYEPREVGLLGRSAELTTLNLALEATSAGNGKCCVIEGEIGMGKSRLVSEFADFAHLKGVMVRYSRSQPSDQSRPLSVFIELVPGLRMLRGAIGCSPKSLESLDRLTVDGSKALFSAKTEDPDAIAENLLSAMMDLLDAVSEERSVILIIDDAQWIDQASSTLFERILTWVESHKVMVIFSVRTPAIAWTSSERIAKAITIRLPALTVDHSLALVHELLRQQEKQASENIINWFVEVGEGNPFFLSELVGHWDASGSTDRSPASLVAITNQRLLSLSRTALQILQTCAILGRFSSIARLEHVLEFKTFELFDGLNELGKRFMVRGGKLPGETNSEPMITCSHELIGSGALRLLSPPAQIAMHRRVAIILESEARKEYSPSLIAESALHWEKAGDGKHALKLTVTYADHLMGIGFPGEAIQTYRKALGFCVSADQNAEVLSQLISALYAAGEWQEVGKAIEELQRIRPLAENSLQEHSQIELIELEAKWRSSSEWSDLFRRVKPCIFSEAASAEHRVRAAVLGLKLAANVGTGEELDQVYSAVEKFLDGSQVAPEARLYVEMVYHIDRGDMERGKRAAMNLVEHQRGLGTTANLIWSLVNASQAMRRCGLPVASIHYLEEAFELATTKNLSTRACTVAHHLILTCLSQDDVVAAKKWLNIARGFSTPSEDLHTRQELLYYGARIALKEGNVEESACLCAQIHSDHDQSLLRRISLLALKVRLAVECNVKTTEVSRMLPELINLYEVECARGGQDFEAFTLYIGRQYVGERILASRQLEEYVTVFRRERGVPPSEIAKALTLQANTGD